MAGCFGALPSISNFNLKMKNKILSVVVCYHTTKGHLGRETVVLKPSHFTGHPYDNVRRKLEPGIIARNTMLIRARLGDTWDLTWAAYKKEREKDGGQGCANNEEDCFHEIMKLTPNAIGAMAFSTTWAEDVQNLELPPSVQE